MQVEQMQIAHALTSSGRDISTPTPTHPHHPTAMVQTFPLTRSRGDRAICCHPLSPRPMQLAARASPSCFASIGLGSNVSTCDGAPFMNKKMTRFAPAGWCANCDAFAALSWLVERLADCKALQRPIVPKPVAARRRRSRREGCICILVHHEHFVADKQCLCVLWPCIGIFPRGLARFSLA